MDTSRIALALAAAALGAPALAQGEATSDAAPKLTIERLYSDPGLSGPTPRAVAFSPDGALVTFLRAKDDDFETFDLWAYDVATGEPRLLVDSKALAPDAGELSEEEKARRERMRITGGGIVSYDWDAKGEAVLAPLGGDIYRVTLAGDGDGPTATRLTESEAFETDSRASPQGGFVSYVRDQNLYVYDLAAGAERAITTEGGGAISYGAAEFVAQEEMYRFTGYWWSPDDGAIAFTRVDESGVDVIERFDIGAEGVSVIAQRYPRAGRPNAVVTLHVTSPAGGEVRDVPLSFDSEHYLARVDWLDADTLIVQRQNRKQDQLDIVRVDLGAEGGPSAKVLFSETSPTWVNLHSDFRAIEGGARFLWSSERSGFRHIYLYDRDGGLVRQVTEGEWPVAETGRGGGGLIGVDEAAKLAYFRGFKDGWLEQHLYAVSYEEPAEPVRITELGGDWNVVLSPDAQSFVGTYSTPDQPPQVALYGIDGARITWIEENALDATHPYAPYLPRHLSPRFGVIPAADGTPLQYSILRPAHCTASNPCPALHLMYGGPGVQTVTNSWGGVTDQLYAQQGYVVFRLDNRGMSNRGKAFEDHIYRAMGSVEVEDQAAGAKFLKSLDYVDADRVGVFGWSYGGYMTLHLLGQHPGLWAAGVSGAPVSDWSLYDTHYTERYMGMPDADADAYAASSVFAHLGKLADPLLMIHGMADDNVTFDNSTRVYAALQSAAVPFEVMVYPGQRHGIRGKALRTHLMATMTDFFERALKPEPPTE